ncbi:unnamed protein product [Urochloa humidicola]
MGFLRRWLEHHRPSLAAVAAAVLVPELVVSNGGIEVRLTQIKAPLSPPFAPSPCLLCRAPRERKTTTCHNHAAIQIHLASLAPTTLPAASTTTTASSSTLPLSAPVRPVFMVAASSFAGSVVALVFAYLLREGIFAVPVLSLAAFPGRRTVDAVMACEPLRRRSFPFWNLHREWTPHLMTSSIRFGGCWLPSGWAPRGLNVLSSGGRWLLVAIKSCWFLCCCAMSFFNTPLLGRFKI